MKISYNKYPIFRSRLQKIAMFSVLVVGITTSAFSEVTYNPDKNTWSGSGTYSETISVSGDTIFNCSAGNITLTGPITGTGTIRHTGPANTLLLKSDLSGFTGTISNEIDRWIEMYSVAGNSTTSGDTSMWDMSHISFTASHTQGFALASQTDVPTTIFAFGDMSTSNASTTIQSSSKSSTVTSTNAKSLIICEVGALNKNSTYAGKFEITAHNPLGINKVGTGEWTLTGKVELSDRITVTGGTLAIGNGGTTGVVSKVDLDLEGTIYNANDTIAPNITIGKAGTLKFNRSDDVKYTVNLTAETSGTAWAGRIYNPTIDTDFISAKLVKDGTGKLTLTFSEDSAVETFARSFSDVNATNNAVFLNADLEIADGTLEIQALNTKINGIGIRGDITGSGTLLHTQNTKLDLFGDNREFTGTLRSSSPAWVELYRACSVSTKAIYDITGANGIAFCSEGAETFHFGALVGNDSNTRITRSSTSSGTPTVKVGGLTQLVSDMDNVFAGKFDGNLNLVKAGPGTWTLTGTSTHTGTTTVEGGVLRLTSTAKITDSNVTVNTGAGLNLEGEITENLTLNGDLVLDFTNGSLNDIGTVFGDVTVGDTASLTIISEGLSVDDIFAASYDLKAKSVAFTEGNSWANMLADAIAAGTASNQWLITATDNGFTLSANTGAVPEPASWALLLGSAVGIVFLRRKSRKI